MYRKKAGRAPLEEQIHHKLGQAQGHDSLVTSSLRSLQDSQDFGFIKYLARGISCIPKA